MQPAPSHRGDLSQDSVLEPAHRSSVKPKPAPKAFNDSASKRTRQAYNALTASSVGLELGVSVVIAVLGGMWLDSEIGTSPWFMLVGMVIGLIAGFRSVFRAVERSDRAARAEENRG
jgi:F0F1-type ATP synthase assembly protein I